MFAVLALALFAGCGATNDDTDAATGADTGTATDAAVSDRLFGTWTHAGGDYVGRLGYMADAIHHDGFVYVAWNAGARGVARIAADGTGPVETVASPWRSLDAFVLEGGSGDLFAVAATDFDRSLFRLEGDGFVLVEVIDLPAGARIDTVFPTAGSVALGYFEMPDVVVIERNPSGGGWTELPGLGEGELIRAGFDGAPLAAVVRTGRLSIDTLRWDGSAWSPAATSVSTPMTFGHLELLVTGAGDVYLIRNIPEHVWQRLEAGEWVEARRESTPARWVGEHEGALYFMLESAAMGVWRDGLERRLQGASLGGEGDNVSLEALGGSRIRFLSTPGGLWLAWDEGSRGMREIFLTRFEPAD